MTRACAAPADCRPTWSLAGRAAARPQSSRSCARTGTRRRRWRRSRHRTLPHHSGCCALRWVIDLPTSERPWRACAGRRATDHVSVRGGLSKPATIHGRWRSTPCGRDLPEAIARTGTAVVAPCAVRRRHSSACTSRPSPCGGSRALLGHVSGAAISSRPSVLSDGAGPARLSPTGTLAPRSEPVSRNSGDGCQAVRNRSHARRSPRWRGVPARADAGQVTRAARCA